MKTEKRHSPKQGPVLQSGGREARQLGALVLEVLAGELRPVEAATALGVGLPRYYQMEKRALEGLLKACEPREKGRKQKTVQKQLEELTREKRRLERELNRAQSLLRASQKAQGLTALLVQAQKPSKSGHKRRRPEVRALKISRNLVSSSVCEDVSAVSHGAMPNEPRAENPVLNRPGPSVS